MNTYIGTKIVNAEPMTEGTFLINIKGTGTALPTQMINDGYLVIYEDGYRSWSPKDVFERSYRKIGQGEYDLLTK